MTINAVSLGWLSKIVKFLASNSPLDYLLSISYLCRINNLCGINAD
jgi:hypothetical protein